MGDMVIIDGVEHDRDEWLAEHAQRAHDEAVAAQEAQEVAPEGDAESAAEGDDAGVDSAAGASPAE